MLTRRMTVLAAALLAVGGSAGAQAAAPLSLARSAAVERAGADAAGSSELRGTTAWIIGAVALALIVWGALELLDDGTNAVPASP